MSGPYGGWSVVGGAGGLISLPFWGGCSQINVSLLVEVWTCGARGVVSERRMVMRQEWSLFRDFVGG